MIILEEVVPVTVKMRISRLAWYMGNISYYMKSSRDECGYGYRSRCMP